MSLMVLPGDGSRNEKDNGVSGGRTVMSLRKQAQVWYLIMICLWDKGCPGGASGKEPACWCRRCKRLGLDPGVGKIPWGRTWPPTPGFLPGEPQGQRSLESYRPWSHRVEHNWSGMQNDSPHRSETEKGRCGKAPPSDLQFSWFILWFPRFPFVTNTPQSLFGADISSLEALEVCLVQTETCWIIQFTPYLKDSTKEKARCLIIFLLITCWNDNMLNILDSIKYI